MHQHTHTQMDKPPQLFSYYWTKINGLGTQKICLYCHANQEWQWRNTLFTIAK